MASLPWATESENLAIAQRAGVGAGTLYRHFPTREALIEAVYRGDIAALTDRAPEAFSPGKERFNQAADSLVGAAQAVGAIRPDVETRDILRMAAGIATSSDGDPAACHRMLTIMFDGFASVPADHQIEMSVPSRMMSRA